MEIAGKKTVQNTFSSVKKPVISKWQSNFQRKVFNKYFTWTDDGRISSLQYASNKILKFSPKVTIKVTETMQIDVVLVPYFLLKEFFSSVFYVKNIYFSYTIHYIP